MNDDLEKDFLLQFQKGLKDLPAFKSEKEKNIFLQLQKYNLIYMTPEGVFVISRRGNEALKYGVKKFLTLERFEERLLKDSLTRETERKWIFFAIIPIIILLSIGLIYFKLEIS